MARLIALTIVVALSACWFGTISMGDCPDGCQNVPGSSPVAVYLLRGDTVRFAACKDYSSCAAANNTGDVLARWAFENTAVAGFVGTPKSALVESASSVLVRGAVAGSATLLVTFPKGSSQGSIVVADSSAITKLEFQPYLRPDTVHQGSTGSLGILLKDGNSFIYRAWPTALTVSDSTILSVTLVTDKDGWTKARISGLKQGVANVHVTFLGLTKVQQVTVVP